MWHLKFNLQTPLIVIIYQITITFQIFHRMIAKLIVRSLNFVDNVIFEFHAK